MDEMIERYTQYICLTPGHKGSGIKVTVKGGGQKSSKIVLRNMCASKHKLRPKLM
jgi:hypothetical protein